MYIYLHIPFCQSHCIYCDFAVELNKYGRHKAYTDAVIKEIHTRFSEIENTEPIETLYIGGGTPLLLQVSNYQKIFDALKQYTRFKEDAEITIEANPSGSVDLPEAYLELGVNRISVGIQSFNNHELKKLSRIHSAREAKDFINKLKRHNYYNISIDLMYGIPEQTLESWKHSIKEAINLNVQHISMYGLKVEDNTPLKKLTQTGAYPLPDEDMNVEMYQTAIESFEAAGYQRYEFSNLAKPGFESRHNLNYWDCGDFLAFGLGAHGQLSQAQYENTRDMERYLKIPTSLKYYKYNNNEQIENRFIFGLRKTSGIDLKALSDEFSRDLISLYNAPIEKYSRSNLLTCEDGILKLTDKGIPVSNTILADFLLN